MEKRLRLGILPGGYNKYVDPLLRCLQYIRQGSPSKEDFSQWFEKTFDAKPKDECIHAIENLNLAKETDNAISLTDSGEKFLDTGNNGVLYQELDNNYAGIHDILELLHKKSCPVEEILSFLREKVGVTWKTKTQCEIRLNWLCSLGYVSKERRLFSITREGRAMINSEIVEEEIPSHSEMQKHLSETAKNYDSVSQKEYPINGNDIDIVWIKSGAENPWAAFEVQVKGNLQEALTNLARARKKWNCRTYLLTTKKQKLAAERLVNEAFPELTDLRILDWSEVSKIERSGKEFLDATVEALGFKPQVLFRRIPSHRRSRRPRKR
jgi:hypothetical protein